MNGTSYIIPLSDYQISICGLKYSLRETSNETKPMLSEWLTIDDKNGDILVDPNTLGSKEVKANIVSGLVQDDTSLQRTQMTDKFTVNVVCPSDIESQNLSLPVFNKTDAIFELSQ